MRKRCFTAAQSPPSMTIVMYVKNAARAKWKKKKKKHIKRAMQEITYRAVNSRAGLRELALGRTKTGYLRCRCHLE